MARICVVVDDPDLATLLTDVLTEGGHEVVVRGEESDVVGYLQQQHPDLVIIHAWLETPTQGIDIVDEVVPHDRATWVPSIVLASNAGDVAGREEWLRARNVHVLLTPFDVAEFDRVVDECLAQDRQVPPAPDDK